MVNLTDEPERLRDGGLHASSIACPSAGDVDVAKNTAHLHETPLHNTLCFYD